MIILSDCLTDIVDEGCLKVANSLTKRLKKECAETTIISYERRPNFSDLHLKLNKLFLNQQLFKALNKNKDSVLYIPFASNTFATMLRLLVLALYIGRDRLNVLFALRWPMNAFKRWMLQLSGARIVALSSDSYEYYSTIARETFYLKAGIDTNKFKVATEEAKKSLRQKYGLPMEKNIVLHVGHLHHGRNVDVLLDIDKTYHVVLVVSSVSEQDKELRSRLLKRPNITLIDTYIKQIEEIYQLADVYIFPVVTQHNSIDVPLSVLEAAACGVNVICTEYGELKNFKQQSGFYFMKDMNPIVLNQCIEHSLCGTQKMDTSVVAEYDRGVAINKLCSKLSCK